MVKRARWVICGALALCLGTFLVGCSSEVSQDEPQEEVKIANDAGAAQDSPSTLDDIVVSTQAGDLRFPEQWTDLISTRQETSEGVTNVVFETEIQGTTYELFELNIGGGEGQLAGSITDASGVQREVYVVLHDISDAAGLTESEQNRLLAMQEDVNYVIDNLK